MEPLTLFTWGYWGWGSAPEKLVQAVDAVEAGRGYRPPMFVDIRISRSVRAPGFNGHAFEHQVGASRYRWLDALGNVAVQEGGSMRIKDPTAVDTLLDLAEKCARDKQRLLFFCSCEFPGVEGQDGCCHRSKVAGLVLKAARRRKKSVRIVEWPGGEPKSNLESLLSAADFQKVIRGATSIALAEPVDLAKMAGIPWFSQVVVHRKEDQVTKKQALDGPAFISVTGPARYKSGAWYLPVYETLTTLEDLDHQAEYVSELRARGFEARQT